VVSTGDTLSSILNQYGIDMGDISQLAAADKELRNLKIGQQLSWTLTGRRSAASDLGRCPAAKPAPTIALQTVSK
jgi:murein DD-endopeptidase MepM/ murein hydrolase activator NlpD